MTALRGWALERMTSKFCPWSQILSLVSDSVLILGYWAFNFLNSSPRRILAIRESVSYQHPCSGASSVRGDTFPTE